MSIGLRIAMPLAAVIGVVTFASAWAATAHTAPEPRQQSSDDVIAERAFVTVARVLRHPRCLNCHPSGDRPRIGEDRVLHRMNVQRGDDGHGVPGMTCSACHQKSNQDLAGVPGAPHWHLAPRSMGWEGLDDHQLAEHLKDRLMNGDRSLAEMTHHLEHDPLVLWGWEPGVGRSAPSVSHSEFVKAFKTWVDHGAVSPPPGTTTY